MIYCMPYSLFWYFMRFNNRYDSANSVKLLDILKWQIGKKRIQKREKSHLKIVHTPQDLQSKEDFICWLGHASFLIQVNQKRFLCDPVFGHVPFYKRYISTPYNIEELGEIDYVMLSHVHYDHFDIPSIRALLKKNPIFLVPKGMDSYLKKINKNSVIHTFDWYETYKTSQETSVNLVPAKHWGRRGLFDTNRALWGGFVITSLQHSIYFAGDTAYDTHFKEIGDRFEIDYALLPIGAYLPRTIMQDNHLNPDEAYQAFKELKAKTLLPMHYGTFKLTDEPLNEPKEWIEKLQLQYPKKITPVSIGEVRFL